MDALKTYGPLAIAAAAIVLVLIQRGEIGDLEQRLAVMDGTASRVASAKTATPTTAIHTTEVRTDKALGDRVRKLESRLRTVSALAKTASQKVLAASVVDEIVVDNELPDLVDELSSLRADVDSLLMGRGVETPEAKETIKKTIEAAHVERRKERHARRAAQMTEWVNNFGADQGLSASVTEELQALEATYREARHKAREAVRAGDKTHEEARAEMRAMREEHMETRKEMLTEEQLEAYDERPRGRGGRGGRGGP